MVFNSGSEGLNVGASISWNPQGLSRPVMGLLYHLHIVYTLCTTNLFKKIRGRRSIIPLSLLTSTLRIADRLHVPAALPQGESCWVETPQSVSINKLTEKNCYLSNVAWLSHRKIFYYPEACVKSVNFHQSTWRHMPEGDLRAARSRTIYPKSDIFWRGSQLRPPTASHRNANTLRTVRVI